MIATMKRREFITLLGGAAAAWPLAARAQQPDRMRRVGVLMNLAADDPEGQARIAAFLQALQQLGWSDGRNVRIDYRWAAGVTDRFHRYAEELLALTMSTASSKARSRPIFRCRRRSSMSLWSTSRPPKGSASKFRRQSSAAPTR